MSKVAVRFTAGFTLLEVMVALIIGTVIMGGVMGLISVSLQHDHRIKEKSLAQPVLEAAAQEILTKPEKALNGQLDITAQPGTPPVEIRVVPVYGPDGEIVQNRSGELYRVMLSCRGQNLEFSLLIPSQKS